MSYSEAYWFSGKKANENKGVNFMFHNLMSQVRRSYAQIVASQGDSPANENAIDRGDGSVWFVSKKGNRCRFSDDGCIRVTVCTSRKGEIGYAWNIDDKSGWEGSFDTFDEAMDHAEVNVFR